MTQKLILVSGLPASGKSRTAKQISKISNAIILRTDKIRKQLIEKPIYSEEEKNFVYKHFLSMAEELLNSGKNVILDATFYRKDTRKQIYDICKRTNSKIYIIECVCPEKEIRRRMKIRGTRKQISDADFEIYRKIKRIYEPIEKEHLVIDTTKKDNLKEISNYLSK